MSLKIGYWVLYYLSMKTCNKCGFIKSLNRFYKNSDQKDGYRNACKSCDNIYHKNLYHSQKDYYRKQSKKKLHREKTELIAFIRRMYNYMQIRVRGYGSNAHYGYYTGKPICSRKAFIHFALKDWDLKYMFCEWIKQKHNRKYVPTVDRLDNAKGYLIDNLQFLSFSDNVKKRWSDGVWRKH